MTFIESDAVQYSMSRSTRRATNQNLYVLPWREVCIAYKGMRRPIVPYGRFMESLKCHHEDQVFVDGAISGVIMHLAMVVRFSCAVYVSSIQFLHSVASFVQVGF